MLSLFFFFKQKTAYEMRISDWSSDVCSSDLLHVVAQLLGVLVLAAAARMARRPLVGADEDMGGIERGGIVGQTRHLSGFLLLFLVAIAVAAATAAGKLAEEEFLEIGRAHV